MNVSSDVIVGIVGGCTTLISYFSGKKKRKIEEENLIIAQYREALTNAKEECEMRIENLRTESEERIASLETRIKKMEDTVCIRSNCKRRI